MSRLFNLDQAVARWRNRLLAAGIRSLDLEELEIHLREDVERQTKTGADVQEAFDIAVQHLGNTDALTIEFRKSGGVSSRWEKLMIGIGAVFVGFVVLLSAFTVLMCFRSWGERVTALAAVVCILVVACRWRYVVPFLPVIAHRGRRWALGLLCIACGFIASSLFCELVLPHFEVSPDRQLPAIGLWAVFLIAVFFCAGVGLLMSEQERQASGMTNNPQIGQFMNRRNHV